MVVLTEFQDTMAIKQQIVRPNIPMCDPIILQILKGM